MKNLACAVLGFSILFTQQQLAKAAATESPTIHLLDTISGPDGAWDYAAVDANLARLYVARGYGVFMLDLATAKATPKLAPGQKVHSVLPLPAGRLLTTNGDSRTATVLDAASGRVTGTVHTGRKPDAAVFDPVSGLAVVMNGLDGDAMLIDPANATSPARIAVGGKLEFAVADGKGTVFVNVENKNQVAVLDIRGRRVAARYAMPGCEEPTGLGLDPESGLLLAVCGNGKAIALDAGTGRVIAVLPIGEGPDAAIFDPATKRFFVPNGDDGSLSVIAERPDGPPETVATVPTAEGARTGALDPATGRLYLPTATKKPGATGLDPETIPGSFRVLVLATR